MEIAKEIDKITFLGEFSDHNLEQEFFQDYMARNLKYIRFIVLVFGMFNTLFIIPDYFFTEGGETFLNILANRMAFLLLILIFFFAINGIRNYKLLACWLTAYEILGSFSFLMVFEQYNRPDFLIQAFGSMVIILVIFIVPNKWHYMLFSSTFVSITFFLFTYNKVNNLPLSEYLAGIVYILIVLILSSLGSFRANYYNRKQYFYGKELLNLSLTDLLTGIYNRSKWNSELEYHLAYSKRYKMPLSVVFFDIDDFKMVNDILGHLAGDKILIEISEIVKNMVRESDVFARWGGDEFLLLLPNTNREQALKLVERLRTAIAEHSFEGIEKLTCSFGLAMALEKDSADSLVRRADQFLYESKLKGKNMVTG